MVVGATGGVAGCFLTGFDFCGLGLSCRQLSNKKYFILIYLISGS